MTLENNNLKEFDVPVDSFIGGWFIDETICDELIQFFNKNNHLCTKGSFIKNNIKTDNIDIKDSVDLMLNTNLLIYPLNLYFLELQKCLNNYSIKFKESNLVSQYSVDTFNIQYYKKGGGYKSWHNERTSLSGCNRHLVFMTYLNDVPKGGTEFKFQKLIIPAKKGLTLIWPTDWTHTHRGQVTNDNEKYIITGWYNYTN